MKSIKRISQWIEKPVTQESDQTDWISLKDSKVNIRPKEVKLLAGTKDAAYFDKDTVLPNRVFLLSDNEVHLVEDINDKIVDAYSTQIADIFGDNSNVATYTFDDETASDLNDNYNGTWKDKDGNSIDGVYDTGVFDGKAAKFDGNNQINCGVVNKDKDELWISFWMYWDGTAGTMPIGFNTYNLYLYDNYFGWNTDNGDTYGIDFSASDYANKWVHVVANFKSEAYGDKLFINGIQMDNLSQKRGSIATDSAVIKNVDFHISGFGYSSDYRFSGLIDQVRIFNRALTEDEVKKLYTEQCKKYDASELNFTSDIKKAFEGTDIYMTLGKSKTTGLLTNRLKRNIKIDTKNTDIENGKLGLLANLENEPVMYIDDNHIETKVIDKADTIQTVDIFGDNSCIALYPFNENTDDLSGNYNTSITGDIAYVDGIFDKGITCTSPDTTPDSDYVPLSTDIFNNNDVFTISLWFKANSINTSYGNAILSNYNCATQVLFDIEIDKDNTFYAVYWDRNKSDTTNYITVKDVKCDTWYHTVLVVDKSTNIIKLYFNGNLVNIVQDSAISGNLSQEPRLFGWAANCESVNMISLDGIIDQVRIFNRALTEDEVKALYIEQRYTIDIKSLNLTGLPKFAQLPYKKSLEVVSVDGKKVTVSEPYNTTHYTKVIADDKTLDVVNVETTNTTQIADIFKDNSNVATYTFDDENANDLNDNYNGTANNSNFVPGVFGGKALATNVDNTSYVEIDNIPSIFDDTNVSFSTWVYFDKNTNNETIINSAVDSNKNSGRCSLNTNGIYVYEGNNIAFEKPEPGWHHYLFTVSSEGVSVYVDGKLVAHDSRTSINDSDHESYNAYCIGNDWYNVANNSNGTPNILIDQVRIFNKALTEDEVKALYTEGKQILELSDTVSSDITTVDLINESVTLKPVEFKSTKATPIGSDTEVDVIEVKFEDHKDRSGYRTVQRGLIIEEPEVEIIEPFVSTVTKLQE